MCCLRYSPFDDPQGKLGAPLFVRETPFGTAPSTAVAGFNAAIGVATPATPGSATGPCMYTVNGQTIGGAGHKVPQPRPPSATGEGRAAAWSLGGGRRRPQLLKHAHRKRGLLPRHVARLRAVRRCPLPSPFMCSAPPPADTSGRVCIQVRAGPGLHHKQVGAFQVSAAAGSGVCVRVRACVRACACVRVGRGAHGSLCSAATIHACSSWSRGSHGQAHRI